MLRLRLLVACSLCFAGLGEAALTPAQYREHVGRIFLRGVANLEDRCQVIEWAITYSKLGVEQQEAARRFIKDYYIAVNGIDPSTASENGKHAFTHFVNDCAETYGEGFQP